MAKKNNSEQMREAFERFINEKDQRKVAKGLIEDNKLFSQLNKLIIPDVFVELNVRLLMGEVKKYFTEKGKVPSYPVLLSLLRQKAKTDIEVEEFTSLINHLASDEYAQDLRDFKEFAVKFFKQQETIKIANKMLKDVQDGFTEDKLHSSMDDIKEVLTPTDRDMGVSPYEYMDDIFNDEDTEKVTTGYMEFDALLNGGLQKGNVGLLVAHTGAGKTTFSTAMAVSAAIKGHNVLQIVFEESEKDITKKQYARLTGDYISNMNRKRISQKTKEMVKQWRPYIEERIIIKKFPNGKTTWEEIENTIFNLESAKGWVPDIIFLDYFDCMKHSTDTRLKLVEAAVRCVRKIEDYAKTHQVAIWLMQQTNRQGAQSATKNDPEGNIQGAFAVQQTTGVNVFLTKSEEERVNNQATLQIKKNRQGKLGTFESFYFNNGNLQIDMSNALINAEMEVVIDEYRKELEALEEEKRQTTFQQQNSYGSYGAEFSTGMNDFEYTGDTACIGGFVQ